MSDSAVYEGWVTHRRTGRSQHAFRYRVFMPLLDLDELPEAARRRSRSGRPAARRPAGFRRADYLGDRRRADSTRRARGWSRSGSGAARRARCGCSPNPRYSGVGFNPVCFYFLPTTRPGALDAVIAEVTNTPWGERHAYVLDAGGAEPR